MRRTETSKRRGALALLGRDLLPAFWAGLAIALLFCLVPLQSIPDLRNHTTCTVLAYQNHLVRILAFAPPQALAQGREPIRVLSSETENHFPDGLTFHLHADADQPLVRIDVYYRTQGGGSTARQPVEFEPGKEVVASYTWDTSRTTVVPSSPVTFYWTLQDQAGNRLTTPEQTVYYDDLRFSWREISDPSLIVRWYEGDEDFGRFAYQTARRALDQMVEQSGRELAYPVFVLLYANDEDFGHLWRRGLTFDLSVAVSLFDEALERGRPQEIRAFRRNLIVGRLGIAVTQLPEDPAELLLAIRQLRKRGGGHRLATEGKETPELKPTDDDLSAWDRDGAPGGSFSTWLNEFLTLIQSGPLQDALGAEVSTPSGS